jgi:DNA-binding GntR family transcriptional regulator
MEETVMTAARARRKVDHRIGGEDDVNAALHAYREIKSRIIDLRYAAGEKLSETRLVAELGVGRSPIRTALTRLKSEGWIAVTPQSGTYVRSPSEKDIEEATDLRILLEMHVTRLATAKIPAAELRKLRRALDLLEHQPMAGHLEEFFDFDAMLHSAIHRAADNALIAGLLTNLREKLHWIWQTSTVSVRQVRRIEHSLIELKAVLRALEARDADAAASAIAKHIRNVTSFYKAEERSSSLGGRKRRAS